MSAALTPPSIILVRPQLGQNVGMAARAMANFGLTDLRIVAPREGWPNEWAIKAASGADWVLEEARLFDTVADAAADIHFLVATTARIREMLKPVVTPEAAASEMRAKIVQGLRCGIMFGPERSGLENDDVTLAQASLRIPVDPRFTSINLAQAVLLIGYEWFKAADATPPEYSIPATPGPPITPNWSACSNISNANWMRRAFCFRPKNAPPWCAICATFSCAPI